LYSKQKYLPLFLPDGLFVEQGLIFFFRNKQEYQLKVDPNHSLSKNNTTKLEKNKSFFFLFGKDKKRVEIELSEKKCSFSRSHSFNRQTWVAFFLFSV
jgi:hypothetical protein